MTFSTALASVARAARLAARRLVCAATLGHDPLFSESARVDREGWWAYPCRKCGVLLWPSVWGGTDERVDSGGHVA